MASEETPDAVGQGPARRRTAVASQGRAAARRRRRRQRRLLVGGTSVGAGAAALALAVTAGWLPGAAQLLPRGGLETTTDGTLTYCTELSYMPFEFEQGAKIVGFDADMVSLVADRLGLEVQAVDTPFTDIVSGEALDSGRCDLAASAVTITAERSQVVSFSSGYFSSRIAVVVPATADITTPADLAGQRVAASESTTGAVYAANLGADVQTESGLDDVQQALLDGSVVAVAADNGVMLSWVSDHPELRVAFQGPDVEQYGLVVRHGDTQLLTAVNAALAQARSDGRYADAYRKWFDAEAPV